MSLTGTGFDVAGAAVAGGEDVDSGKDEATADAVVADAVIAGSNVAEGAACGVVAGAGAKSGSYRQRYNEMGASRL
ncbi:hypothetical protein KXD40_008500 [Peronospora effusa]|uniref:Uncharacterized protein n=1 Tax=Peronospora effusa TaxID=542832 RepID=A0A3M6VA81_9STRA|nr:hypothetical protein DD238_007187 [Peronospora effusa]RQM10113.1 hypothetical protein DD237_005587 [Peronospora effusa]UIZ24339.1 hypothetical protein KXD40_008500 [Peronospora effusa]CAI5728916.1 unnamed protein product [Peronospora effusa]